MKKLLFLFGIIIFFSQQINCQTYSPNCVIATPFGEGVSMFPSTYGNTPAETGPDYGCLISQPNPSWFYCKIDTSGTIIIDITQTTGSGTGVDIDFVCWGPFSSPSSPCTAQLDSAKIVDCSYSTAFTETANIPNGIVGEYYILLVTNFSNTQANVVLSVNTAGTGSLATSAVCETYAYYNSPLCVNGTLQLLSTAHFGQGNYLWSGPNGFSDTLQNPTLASVNAGSSGYYYVNYTKDSTCNFTDSIWVSVDTCGTLTGNAYADANANCALDTSENPVGNVQLKLTQGANFIGHAWTDNFGYYYFNVLPGNYTLEVVQNAAHPVTCANSQPHTVTVSGSAITTENFAIDCNAADFAATWLGVSGFAFMPGQSNIMYPGVYSFGPNCNTTPVPGQVVVILDPLVSYTSPAGTAPDTIITAASGDTLKWNVADINAYTYWGWSSYSFVYTTSTAAQIGDSAYIDVYAISSGTDIDTSNNHYRRGFEVGAPYDPNIKEVIPAGLGTNGFIPATTPELNYTIHFQNTGTAPAQNVYILDTLSANVDMSSLKIIASSHLQTTTFLPGNVLKFYFSNIMLPDSTNDEPGSHGFVQYSIAPLVGLAPGTQIENRGYIYFDFNPAIVTNTALNTIEFPTTGISENTNHQLEIFPNPSSSFTEVYFESKPSSKFNLRILNLRGQIVYEENVSDFNGKYNKKVNTSAWAAGVYLFQINTGEQIIHRKLVKN